MTEQGNFKVIVALKCSSDQKISNVRCAIQLMDKVKYTILPQSEGQFFDLSTISLVKPLTISFDQITTQKRLGVVAIPVPSEIYSQEEVELADIFTLEYQADGETHRFTGRYYIIILNKGGRCQIPLEDDPETIQSQADMAQTKKEKRAELSPTRAYLLSSNERNQERFKKDQSKKLLKETKFDPPKSNNNQKNPLEAKKSNGKKQNSNSKIPDQSKSFTEDVTMTSPQRSNAQRVFNNDSDDNKYSPFQKYSENNHMSPQQKIGELEAQGELQRSNIFSLENQQKMIHKNIEINDRTQDDLQRSELKRKELQQVIRESVSSNMKLREEVQRNMSELAKEKLAVEQKLRASNQTIEEQNKTMDGLKQHLSTRDKKITELLNKVVAIEEFSKICHIQQEKIEDQDKVIKECQLIFQKNLLDLAATIQELEQQKLQALKDKAQTELTVQDLINQMQRLKENNVSLQALQEQTDRKYQLALAHELAVKTLKAQNVQLQNEIQDSRYRNDQLNALINQLKKDIGLINQQQEINQKLNKNKQSSLAEVLKGQESRIHDLQNETGKLKKDNLNLKDLIFTLQLKVNQIDEIMKQIEQYKKDYNTVLEDNNKLTSTVSDLIDQLKLSNQQILDLRNEVLAQSAQVLEQQQYTNNLKRIMLEMQERGIAYIPAVGDNIDNKLAQWINKSLDGNKYRQLFIREGEGVYQFGNKKVYVKIEQDKILIRSGGGFMTIEEFLQMFQQREMENLQRSDPIAALQKNAAVMKKIDNMKLVNTIKNEGISPLKKKGTIHYE